MLAHHGIVSACATRASISAGRSIRAAASRGCAVASAQGASHRVLTADDPGDRAAPPRRGVRRFRRRRARHGGPRHERRRSRCRRHRLPMRCSMRCRIPSSSCRRTASGRRQCRRGRFLRGLGAAAAAASAARPGAVRQPAALADRAGARARRGGQRIQGRSRHAAQSRRPAGRSARRAAAGAARTMWS